MEQAKETRYPNSLLYGFITLTALLFIILIWLAYLADNSLHLPVADQAIAGYKKYTHLLSLINRVGFLLLLAYANVYFWKKKQGGLLFIVSFLFAALFINLDYSYLSEVYFHYKKSNGLWKGEFSLAPLFGFIITAFVLALVAANYVVLKIILKEKAKREQAANTPPASPPVSPPSDPS